ncbi:MAG: YARHG domain-containing protein [Bacteroidota bacterium]
MGLSSFEKERPDGKEELEKLDQRIFTQDMLKKYSAAELRILRNSIFARHGYRFKSPDLQSHFQTQKWYKESGITQAAILKELNPIEKVNIQLIQEMENLKR